MQIILDTYGLSLGVRNGCFYIVSGDEKRMVHPQRVSSILVTMPCRISTPAIILAAVREIPLTICSRTGKPEARLWSPRFLNLSTVRRKQYSFSKSLAGINWAKEIISLKVDYQKKNLLFIADCKQESADSIADAIDHLDKSSEEIKGIDNKADDILKTIRFWEAYAARNYWPFIGQKLPEPFCFSLRIKKNPADAFNPCINYLYGMLRNQVETAILSLGLDPALGIIHRDGYKLPSLVFDMMEPFRPLTDRILLEAIFSGKLSNCIESDKELKVTRVSKPGRKKLIELFNKKCDTNSMYRGSSRTLHDHVLAESKYLLDKVKQHENT
jgi:CRISP-associated protein Cas1